jgi:hypothetical protein
MKYKSLDEYELKGRGVVFMVENDKHRSNHGGKDGLIGSVVNINGKDYTVRAVEAFAKIDISKGDKIGLLV